MIERRDFTSKRMISAAKRAGLLQGKNVGWLFYNAEQFRGTTGISADFADFAGSKKPAQTAGANGVPRFGDGARNLLRLIVSRTHHPQRNPLCRTRTDSRH